MKHSSVQEKYDLIMSKVVYDTGTKKLNLDDMKLISCTSDLFGTFKKNLISNMFKPPQELTDKEKQKHIVDYMRRNNCDIQHLNYIKTAFL
jgi:hypothetical protein